MIKMFYPVQFNISLNCVHMVGQCREWHTIIGIGQHTQSDDIRRQMPSFPLDRKHDGKTSGVACNHRSWTTHIVRWSLALHAIMSLGQHTRSDYVGRGRPSSPLGSMHWVEWCRSWHAIISLGKHTRLEDVGHVMSSSPFESTHDCTTSCVAML